MARAAKEVTLAKDFSGFDVQSPTAPTYQSSTIGIAKRIYIRIGHQRGKHGLRVDDGEEPPSRDLAIPESNGAIYASHASNSNVSLPLAKFSATSARKKTSEYVDMNGRGHSGELLNHELGYPGKRLSSGIDDRSALQYPTLRKSAQRGITDYQASMIIALQMNAIFRR
jgi:hypothetical protein